MALDRSREIVIAQTNLPIPCFFPSVSSVKTNLKPVDYVELLNALGHPLFLVSAYDIASCTADQRVRMDTALKECRNNGSVILMDSGNYEGFWHKDQSWLVDSFHEIAGASEYQLCFCYDNRRPSCTSDSIAAEVVGDVIRDQHHALGTVAPIVHGASALLSEAARMTAEQLYPLILAVPERELGDGIVERTRTVRKIREALDTLEVYCPLHLLGTGNPISIIAYALAGADSFDGLEWCQTVVDHRSGQLFHFQHWDLVQHQTEWGRCPVLPYLQSVLAHNLEFYRGFMADLHLAIHDGDPVSLVEQYAPKEHVDLLLEACEGLK